MKTNKTLLSSAVALGLMTSSLTANAAGFQLAEYSATGLGRAYAGEAAIADNAGSQWRNPALLTELEGTQMSVGMIYVDPNVDVEGTVTHGDTTTHAASNDFAHDAFIPNFYLSHRLNEQWALGLAFGTNYGMETDLGKNFGASHFGDKASIISKEGNFNAAYQMTPTLSIGGGLRVVMAEGHFGASASKNNSMQIAPGMNLPLQQGTTLKYMEGDDISWGWQIGTLWQMNENNRIGFTYKSQVELTLEGHAEGVGFGLLKPGQTRDGSMDLILPATAEIASYHQMTDKLAMHASFNWTDWSSFDKLEADFSNKPSSMVKVENWEDNYRFAVGATYQVDSKLALRTGVAYDTSAVTDHNRAITIPETDRTWLSIGAGYQWSEQLSLDAGFTYILAKDAPITESRGYESDDLAQSIGGRFVGETTGSIWLLGVQANYRF